VDREADAVTETSRNPTVSKDYSLKQGQTIKIKLNRKGKDSDALNDGDFGDSAPIKPVSNGANINAGTKAQDTTDLLGFSSFSAASPTSQP